MSNLIQTLPSFDAPPIVETALGIEFEPLKEWSVIHFGLLHSKLKFDYPKYEIQPPVGVQNVVEFGFPDNIPMRLWFLNESEDRLLQVQNSRLIYNWRKFDRSSFYPRYKSLKPTFRNEWLRFCDFLESNGIEQPNIQKCEVTYINQIESGEGWKTLKDIGDIFPSFFGSSSSKSFPNLDSINTQFIYDFSKDGQLIVRVQSAKFEANNSDEDKVILQFQLTLVGSPDLSQGKDLFDWFDRGREIIVSNFADFTSPKMHTVWKRTE